MRDPSTAGLLLALEGIDGSGKSTLQKGLARRLARRGVHVALWKEPVDAAIGRAAQGLGPTDPLGAAIEFTVDRWIARPALEALLLSSDLVISDRSFYSTLAYQGSALPAGPRRGVARLQTAATVAPDRVLLMDLPISSALARVASRGHERAPLERAKTLRRVRASYLGYARRGRWKRLDARRPPAELAGLAEAWVLSWLPARRRRRARGRG